MDATPKEDQLWEGIGGHFDSFNQVISEFIDNCIANFEGNSVPARTIYLKFSENPAQETISVSIEDSGTGIEYFEPVLRIGEKSVGESPLNEHGFGLKHALASADQENRNWKILTRTEQEIEDNQYRTVSAPYRFDFSPETVSGSTEPWPGMYNGSGTIVEFDCPTSFFDTVQEGIPGSAGFERTLDYLREDLGYTYAGVIADRGLSITVTDGDSYSEPVSAIEPNWVDFYTPSPDSVERDLGAGEVEIQYKFGEMAESDYVRHYKRNMDTSGVEVRVNGRVLVDNLFSEIWDLERHPQYNHFLAVINIKSDDIDKLPKTKTAKNGIRSGDPKLSELYKWVRQTRPDPPKKLTTSVRESDLVEELVEQKERHIRSPDRRIEDGFLVYDSINAGVEVDVYLYDGTDVVLYEAKKDTADMQSLYQLLMYWNGAVEDGIEPTEGLLIATEISEGVEDVMGNLNDMTDVEGNNYNFDFVTWRSEGVDYPSST